MRRSCCHPCSRRRREEEDEEWIFRDELARILALFTAKLERTRGTRSIGLHIGQGAPGAHLHARLSRHDPLLPRATTRPNVVATHQGPALRTHTLPTDTLIRHGHNSTAACARFSDNIAHTNTLCTHGMAAANLQTMVDPATHATHLHMSSLVPTCLTELLSGCEFLCFLCPVLEAMLVSTHPYCSI